MEFKKIDNATDCTPQSIKFDESYVDNKILFVDSRPILLKKPNHLIKSSSNLTVKELLYFNILLMNATLSLNDKNKYQMSFYGFKKITNYEYKDLRELKRVLHKLVERLICINELEEDGKAGAQSQCINSIVFTKNAIHYSFTNEIHKVIQTSITNGDYTKINIQKQMLFRKRSSAVIYELAAFYAMEKCIPWHSLNWWRHVVNARHGTYSHWALLKRDYFTYSIKEVNDNTEYFLELSTLGRPVSEIQIYIEDNDEYTPITTEFHMERLAKVNNIQIESNSGDPSVNSCYEVAALLLQNGFGILKSELDKFIEEYRKW